MIVERKVFLPDGNYNITLDDQYLGIPDPGSITYRQPARVALTKQPLSDPGSCSTLYINSGGVDGQAILSLSPLCFKWPGIFMGTIQQYPKLGDGMYLGLPNDSPGFYQSTFHVYIVTRLSNGSYIVTFFYPGAKSPTPIGYNPKNNSLEWVAGDSPGNFTATFLHV